MLAFFAVVVVIAAASITMAVVIRSYLYTRIDEQVLAIPRATFDATPTTPTTRALGQRCVSATLGSGLAQIVDPSGVATPLCPDMPTVKIDHASLVSASTDDRLVTATAASGQRFRVRVDAVDDGRWLVIGLGLGEVERTVTHTVQVLIISLLTVAVALLATGRWILRRGLDPLDEIAASADAIAAGDRSHRIGHTGRDDEVGRVAVALNDMLDDVERSLTQQQRSEERLRRFVADASHELRTPLTSIRGYADLYRHGGLVVGATNDALDDAMVRIDDEAARMGRLVDDMLRLADLDQRPTLRCTSVDLVALLHDAAADSHAADPRWPVSVRATGPVEVEADIDAIRQVVANLIANARAHTPAGTPIRLATERDGFVVTVQVADDGPGIPPDLLPSVFDRFVRADPARRRTPADARGGSGLGLSIVDQLVRSHDGTVTVRNCPGATFTVRIPDTGR
jgi:two-component system, OmpR family, sensor kinase